MLSITCLYYLDMVAGMSWVLLEFGGGGYNWLFYFLKSHSAQKLISGSMNVNVGAEGAWVATGWYEFQFFGVEGIWIAILCLKIP